MVQASGGAVNFIVPLRRKLLHCVERCGLGIIVAKVHALHAHALIISKVLHFAEIQLFPGGSFGHGPIELLFGYKLRQANHGDPRECFLMGVIDPALPLLPPKALQRRHHIFKIAWDLVGTFVAHFGW